MRSIGSPHPRALAGAAHTPGGALLPARGSRDTHRSDDPVRAALDVIGGVAFAILVGLLCVRTGSQLMQGAGWLTYIGRESVWLVAAMLCSTLMPSGIQHDISWRSTLEGLLLDWPEMLYATWVFGVYSAYLGQVAIAPGPLGLALAVGTAEEFIFRVLLLGWLVTRISAPAALVVSSLVFGAAHLHAISIADIVSVAPQTAGGFMLGAIYLRSRNPIGPILAHAFWDLPYFAAPGIGFSFGAGLLPWIAFSIYGLWLVRDGIPLVGRVEAVECACEMCAPVQHRVTGVPRTPAAT